MAFMAPPILFALAPLILGGSLAGILCCNDKRSIEFPEAVLAFDPSELRVKDLRRFQNGIQMNTTGMPEGRAMFSLAGNGGFEPVEGSFGGLDAKPYRGLHMGNLSFTVPGLEGDNGADVQGKWVIVSQGEEGEAGAARKFREVYGSLKAGKQDVQKMSADLVDAIMQAS